VKNNIMLAKAKQMATYDRRNSNSPKFAVGAELLKNDFI
jgi:hypothetical protein